MEYSFINIETTGPKPVFDRIIEIAVLKTDNKTNEKKIFHNYFKPEIHLSKKITGIIKVDNCFLRSAPLFRNEVDNLINFIGHSTLIAHNIKFIISFLNNEFKRIGRSALNNNIIDTLSYARKLHPNNENTLDFICKKYDFQITRNDTIRELLVMPKIYNFLKKRSTN